MRCGLKEGNTSPSTFTEGCLSRVVASSVAIMREDFLTWVGVWGGRSWEKTLTKVFKRRRSPSCRTHAFTRFISIFFYHIKSVCWAAFAFFLSFFLHRKNHTLYIICFSTILSRTCLFVERKWRRIRYWKLLIVIWRPTSESYNQACCDCQDICGRLWKESTYLHLISTVYCRDDVCVLCVARSAENIPLAGFDAHLQKQTRNSSFDFDILQKSRATRQMNTLAIRRCS